MKRYFLLAGIVLLLFGAGSCKKDEQVQPTPLFKMNFTLTAGGIPFDFHKTITWGPTKYYLDIFRFYAGLPRLVKTDGTEVPLINTCIVKFDDGLPDDPVCNHSFSFTIPPGSYKAIKFGIGMPEAIRDTISQFHTAQFDPLDQGYGMLWPMTINEFRNIAIEMAVDSSLTQNIPINMYKPIHYHILEDRDTLPLYKDLTFNEAFTVKTGDTHTTTFNIDANKIFFNPDNPIDIRHGGSTDMIKGNTAAINLGLQLNQNFYASITKQ